LRGLPALGAHRVEHRTLGSGTAAIALSGTPALGAAGRLVLEALLRIELLFASGEREFGATVPASEVPVLKSHVSPQFRVSEMTKPRASSSERADPKEI